MNSLRVSLKDKTLVFLHIQKCAGNALLDILQSHYRPRDLLKAHLLHPQAPEIQRPIREYRAIIGHNTYEDIQALGIDPVYITMLRDPIERVASLYYFWRSHRWEYIRANDLRGPALAKELSLSEFLECDEIEARLSVSNGQAGQLLNGLRGPIEQSDDEFSLIAKKRLQTFPFVGITEEFSSSAELLCHTFGWTPPRELRQVNVSSANETHDPRYEHIEREPLTDELRSRIAEHNRVDIELYDYACEFFQQRIEKMRSEKHSEPFTRLQSPRLAYRFRRYLREQVVRFVPNGI